MSEQINHKQILYMAIREIVEAKALTTSPKAIIHLKVQNSPNCKTCNGSGEIKTECPNGCQGPDDYCSLCCNDYQDDLFGYVFEPCPDCQHSKFAKWYEA